jgi:Txe/YoeB family toxin of toxin-antitoxin system
VRGAGAALGGGGQAAEERLGVSAEVMDLRTLSPFDMESIAESVKKTNRVIVAHEDSLSWGIGAEIAARIADELFPWLDAPVKRVGLAGHLGGLRAAGGARDPAGALTRTSQRPPGREPPTRSHESFWHARFVDDLRWWVQHDPRTADRLLRIAQETVRQPFVGIGKPEPLRGEADTWSRRLTDEHRIVYQVGGGRVTFLSARGHYH